VLDLGIHLGAEDDAADEAAGNAKAITGASSVDKDSESGRNRLPLWGQW
jgi:hypothetical protein